MTDHKYPSDFKEAGSIEEQKAIKILGPMSRMVCSSKTIYRYDNPNNCVIFNSNVFTRNKKIWYGDLDLTLDLPKLKELSKTLEDSIYVLYEMDGRFENEKAIDVSKAFCKITFDSVDLNEQALEYYEFKDGTIFQKVVEEKEFEKVLIDYKREDFEEREIELPDLKAIKIKKGTSPFEPFQNHFVELYGKEDALEFYLKLWVSEDYYNELEDKVSKCFKKTYPNIHPAKLEQSVAFEMLNYAPSTFNNTPQWYKPNKAYIKK